MRKWDIQKLIQNWTSFNSLKKLEKIFENLKEDRDESESEEEENRSDEAKTAPEGEEKGADDQNCENEEDIIEVEVAEQETTSEKKNKWEKELQKKEEEIRCMTVEKDNLKKKLNEKEQELEKITEEMVNLEERNATLVTENLCLASSVKELGVKLKELEQMLSPKTHTSPAAQQHSSPPPNSTEEKNESNGAASKAAENTEKKDQSTVEEGQSHGICTVEESAAAAAQSPPHCTIVKSPNCTVAEESQSTPPSHKDSQFQSPTVHRPTVAEMEQQPDMFQIVKSPIVAQAFPLRTLSIEKEQKTPEQSKKGELTMHLTEQHSGQTMVAQQKLDDLPEDVLQAIKEMEAEEQARINEEPKEKQLPPEVIDWEESKVYNFMDQDTKRRVQKYWQNAPSGVYFWDGRRYGAQVSRQDLKDMIMDEPIASNCIECYGILLTDQLLEKESQGLDAPSFMNPLCWIEMVELWMTAVKQQADDMLEQGCRMKFDEKNSSEEQLKMMEVPLTETKKESIRWIKDNYKQKMAVTEMKDNPQQGEDS
ncbi:Golgi integral membrane protein 4-like [Rosa sericea]